MYRVWDSPTRWFHWINVLTVVLMVLTGFLFMFRKELAIESVEAKYALLMLHVWIGYVFAANLLIRIVWGFVGNRFARWRSVLPTRQTIRALGQDLRDLIARRPSAYLGRSPLGRVAMTLMFLLLLIVLHVTGVVLTETHQRSGVVSAMFSGQKTLAVPPVDAEPLAPDDRPVG